MTTIMLVANQVVLKERYLAAELFFQAINRWQKQRTQHSLLTVKLIEAQQSRLGRVQSRFLGLVFP
jgi:hypothetical protein